MLHLYTNPLVTELAAFNMLLYCFVYTPLKRLSQINTWIGAFVGAIPPLMGWAAVTESLQPGILACIYMYIYICCQHYHFLSHICWASFKRIEGFYVWSMYMQYKLFLKDTSSGYTYRCAIINS
ncbi:unnamed protein product [Protopolystoma xenopodis]|uniref:Heme O synthase n=1 Tax=Protopolystoma xenopodis TaxID=117903 RepID=A0A3S5FES3_9PLAT|nr:unnamed protein product [Protopolystoma xenopodis]